MKSKNLLFIPTYNCEKQISRVLDSFFNSRKSNGYFQEVVIIDNGSTDKTIETAEKTISNLTVENTEFKIIKNNSNYNLGGSHKVAFNYSISNNYDYVFVCQGDDQGKIIDLVNNFDQNDTNYFGSRFENSSKRINYSFIRTVGNIFFAKLFSLCLFVNINELGCGQSIFRVKDLKDKFYLSFPNDLYFTYYITTYMILNKKIKYKYIPINWVEFDQNSTLRPVRQSINIMKLFFGILIYRIKYFNTFFVNEVDYSYSVIKTINK